MSNVILSGQAGRIEAVYSHNASPTAPLAIVLHPNPLQGGTMNNRISHALYKTLTRHGFSVVKFNFRGVNLSQGVHDNGIGELNDAMVVLDWLQKMNPGDRETWVVGYSFGALVGMQLLMRRPDIRHFISVCPPANIYDFSFLAPCPVPGLIVNGEDDVICPIEHVEKLVERLNAQRGLNIQYNVIPECNHIFDGHVEDLLKIVVEYINNNSTIDEIV